MDLGIDDENAKYCSACLAVDVKMILLQEPNLLEVFESITRNTGKNTPSILQYLCYRCLALLKKCAQFHSMCCQAQQLLNALKPNCIATIRTYLLKEPLNLKISEVELVSYIPDVDTEIATETKIEDSIEFHQELHNYDFDTNFNTVSPESPIDIKIFDEKIQTVQLDQTKVIDDPALCESDLDQPLAVSKTNLLSEVIEKPTKKKILKKTVSKTTKIVKNNKVQEKIKPVVKKRKAKFNKYNEKFEEDFEEFCKVYNVNVVFLTKEQQIERMKERYQDDKYRRRCELCFAGFVTDIAYEKHVKWHDPSNGSLVCEVCQLRFKNKVSMQSHVRRHKREFICKLCNKPLRDSYLAKQHHRWHEGFKHECKHCKKKFDILSSYFNHIYDNHKQMRCPECGDTFEGNKRLKRHENSAHGTVYRKAYRKAYFGVQLQDKPESRQYKCEACPSTFPSYRARGAHWAAVHMEHQHIIKTYGKRGRPEDDTKDASADIGTQSYLCELCAKSYKTLLQLKKHHTNVHPEGLLFKCDLCARAFNSKCMLAVHINTHTGDRPYQCKQCPERFKSYSQRYKHRLLVHEKERPFKCNQCPKDYVLMFDLKTHIRHVHLHHPRPPRKNPRRKPNKIVQ